MSATGAVLGKRTKLSLGKAANTLVDFTGMGRGTQNVTRGRSIGSTTIPGGRGVTASQLGKFVTHDFGVTCDSNATHDPVLRDAFGQRLYGQLRELGDGSGKPQSVFECVAQTLTITFDLPSDRVTWSLSTNVDGTPNDAVQ